MITFIKRFILFASLPLILFVSLYLLIDPFKVLYHYDEYINTNKDYQITWNRDYQSTEQFLENYKRYNYDSFIFGNSRSFFYRIEDLQNYVKGNFFHFNASNENIYGIAGKLQFLDEHGITIKNALVVVDQWTLGGVRNLRGHLKVKHPKISGESSLAFHYKMFMAFASKAIVAHTEIFFTNKLRKYMRKYGIRERVWKHNKKTNEIYYYLFDRQIEKNPDLYYRRRKKFFYPRDGKEKFFPPRIHVRQKKILLQIKRLLSKNNARFKIIVSPLYDQTRLNKKDLNYLKDLFGATNVFDFSGINNITNDYRNYYDKSHYLPKTAAKLIATVYGKENRARRPSKKQKE